VEVVGHLVVVGVNDVSAAGDVIAAAAVGLFAKRRPLFTIANFVFSTNLICSLLRKNESSLAVSDFFLSLHLKKLSLFL